VVMKTNQPAQTADSLPAGPELWPEHRYLQTISDEQLNLHLLEGLSLEFLKSEHALPVVLEDGTVAVALADPLNLEAYDTIVTVLGQPCPRAIAPVEEIDKAISRCYYEALQRPAQPDRNQSQKDQETNPLTQPANRVEDLLNIDQAAPAIQWVNAILFRAVQSRASDVHIEPYDDRVRIRFRIDGVLHEVSSLAKHQLPQLLTRLKIMANLNIAERRLPQDGQCRIKIGQELLDIRVSIIPTLGGERVMLRLLDKGRQGLTLEQIGFNDAMLRRFRSLIRAPHGIILITGPTGSGKTTTLYATLNELNCEQRNILTVEDPIEYQLPGIGQMQVKPKINLTFASCLRHILRQDPDVIMIGEIRDLETAQIAIQASLTGHLVLSTLHTNDAASAVTRLVDMGIEPYLISSSVLAAMAQRLVRLICPHCKRPVPPDSRVGQMYSQLGETCPEAVQLFEGGGCKHCLQTGYYGRTGIFELLVFDEQIRKLIGSRADAQQIKQKAIEKGMLTLRQDGLDKARRGLTSLAEVLRVTQDSSM